MNRVLFRVEIMSANGTVTARLIGELDLAARAEIEAAMAQLLESGALAIDLDLAQLTFVDASSLRRLIDFGTQLRAQGRMLVLRNPSRLVRRLLTLTGVDEVARIE